MAIQVITVQQLEANKKLNTPFEVLKDIFDLSDESLEINKGMCNTKISVSHRGTKFRK